jgi:hypothetical protein
MSTAKLVRIFSGEEILAKVTINEAGDVTLDEPILIMPAGEGRIGFAPYCPFTEENITIRANHVVFVVEPTTALADNYRQATTGIHVPDNGGLIV